MRYEEIRRELVMKNVTMATQIIVMGAAAFE